MRYTCDQSILITFPVVFLSINPPDTLPINLPSLNSMETFYSRFKFGYHLSHSKLKHAIGLEVNHVILLIDLIL